MYYRYGDGIVTESFSDPDNTEATAIGDHLYCGSHTVTSTDLLGDPTSTVTVVDNLADNTWQLTLDGSSLPTELVVGDSINFKV